MLFFVGFRYELYCGSKVSKTTQCTIFTIININEAWTFNENRQNQIVTNNEDSSTEKSQFGLDDEPYTRETFDALVLRFFSFFIFLNFRILIFFFYLFSKF